MEKLLNKLPLGLFFVYSVKLLFLGATPFDVMALAVLGAVAAFFEFKKDVRIEALQKDIKDLNVRLDQKDKEMGELRTYVSSTKLTQAYRR